MNGMDSQGKTSQPHLYASVLAFAAIMAIGLGLRVWHLDSSFNHPDEAITLTVSTHLASGSLDTNWNIPDMPPEFRMNQYNFSGYLYATHAFQVLAANVAPESWSTERSGLLLHRLFSALCGTVVVALVFFAGRRLGGVWVGLLGALGTAVNPLLVQDGHYGRPEAFVTLLSTITLCLCVSKERPSIARIAWACALVGWMTATKVTLGAMLLVPGLAVLLGMREADGRSSLRVIGAGAAGFVAGLALGAPFAVLNPSAWWEGIGFLARQYGGFHPPHNMPDGSSVWPLMSDYFLATLGWPLVLLMGAGLARFAMRREFRAALLLGLPVLFYVVYFGEKRVFFERNLSHIVPFALILTSVGVVFINDALVQFLRREAARVAAAAIGLAVLSPGLGISWRLCAQTFSGLDGIRAGQYREAVMQAHPRLDLERITLCSAEDRDRFALSVGPNRAPFVAAINDFNDRATKARLVEFEQRYNFEKIGVFRGEFADLPISTLGTYHGHFVRYVIVLGERRRAD